MAIDFECDECFKKYRVKDEYAGRRLNCKDCGCNLRVPLPDDENEIWDSSDFGAYEDEDDTPYRPPKARQRKKKKRRRSRHSDSMPVSVIIAEIILALISLISVLDIIGYLILQDIPKLAGAVIRVTVLIALFVGIKNRSNSARKWCIALSIIGLLFQGVNILAVLNGRLPGGPGLLLIVGFVTFLIVTLLISLLTPSARDYSSE